MDLGKKREGEWDAALYFGPLAFISNLEVPGSA
jgi:hypothetical protein